MTGIIFAVALVVSACSVHADNTNTVGTVKPDLLKTCPVSGDKLGGDMGKPFVFVYKGQEVKLCCKDCKAEFDKNPDKFIKKIQDAAAPKK